MTSDESTLYLPRYKCPKESGDNECEVELAILFFVDGERLHQCMLDLTGSPGGNISVCPTLQRGKQITTVSVNYNCATKISVQQI